MKKSIYFPLLLVCLLVALESSQCMSEETTESQDPSVGNYDDDGFFVDQSDWIDPSDMTQYSTEKLQRLEKAYKSTPCKDESNRISELKEKADQCINEKRTLLSRLRLFEKDSSNKGKNITPVLLPYVKRYVKFMLETVPHKDVPDPTTYIVRMTVSEQNHADLKKFLSTGNGEGTQELFFALENMVTASELYVPQEQLTQPNAPLLGEETAWNFFYVTTGVSSCIFALYLSTKLNISWISLLWRSLVALFFISVPWNWWHLYQNAVAKQHAAMLQDMPEACKPNHQKSLWSHFTSQFFFQSDECVRYHEQLIVDPMWEVSPTTAIAVTVTKFFMEPMQIVGQGLNNFIRGTLEGLPIHLQWIFLPVCIGIILLAVIMLFGYNVQLLHFFRIEHSRAPGILERVQMKAQLDEAKEQVLRLEGKNQDLEREKQNLQLYNKCLEDEKKYNAKQQEILEKEKSLSKATQQLMIISSADKPESSKTSGPVSTTPQNPQCKGNERDGQDGSINSSDPSETPLMFVPSSCSTATGHQTGRASVQTLTSKDVQGTPYSTFDESDDEEDIYGPSLNTNQCESLTGSLPDFNNKEKINNDDDEGLHAPSGRNNPNVTPNDEAPMLSYGVEDVAEVGTCLSSTLQDSIPTWPESLEKPPETLKISLSTNSSLDDQSRLTHGLAQPGSSEEEQQDSEATYEPPSPLMATTECCAPQTAGEFGQGDYQ